MKPIHLWLQAACISAQFLRSQSWSIWTSTFPNGQVSVADGFDCQRTVTLSGTKSIRSGCPDIWWHRQSTTIDGEAVSTTGTPQALSTCSSMTWSYRTNMTRNFTMPHGSSHSEFARPSFSGYRESLSSDSTETITSTISRTLTATLLSVAASSSSTISSNEVVVGPAVIETLTTRIVPAETVTETYTHSAIVMTTVTTSILCTCGESGIFATGKTFCRFRLIAHLFNRNFVSNPKFTHGKLENV